MLLMLITRASMALGRLQLTKWHEKRYRVTKVISCRCW